jgi:gamma-glutamyltranspeptidase/glutathione hydrolase
MEVLEAGGNAFDAAVAVAASLGVVEPAASGLGGGGFFLLYVAETGEYRFVDAREVAPGSATRTMFLDEAGEPVARASTDGPLAAGIPGQAAGLEHLADNYGVLPLERSLQPAIKQAREGFPISARALLGLRFRKRTLENSPAFAEMFYPGGQLPAEGDVIVQTDLADTLERFAQEGSEGFYAGKTADLLVDGVRAAGGIWTREDLAGYRVVEREPMFIDYGDMRVVTAPPPSSGGVVLTQIFNFLAEYPMAELSATQRYHYMIEAMKLAYRDRAIYLGDPDFVSMPLELILTPEYMGMQRQLIRDDQATPSSNLEGIRPDGGEGTQTTHFSVMDSDGNRVAATLTINTWYGAGFIPPGTGVILNNEMDDFSIKRGVPNEFGLLGDEANSVAPGKRPLSSMSPSFLESEQGVAILGTPGGSRIITMVLQSALAWYEGADAASMVTDKRFHHQYWPDVVNFEDGAFTADELAGLTEMGHELKPSRRPFGNMNVVTWDYATGEVRSATDPRGEGEARVY